MRTRRVVMALAGLALAAAPAARAARPVEVGYATAASLRGLHVVRVVGPLRIAEVVGASPKTLAARPGIAWAHPTVPRLDASVGHTTLAATATEWEFGATRSNLIPARVWEAASSITVAVVDTGADTSAPDLAGRAAVTYDVVSGKARVDDTVGHGTFVASLVAGAGPLGGGVEGFGGDARLMVVQANRTTNTFTDVDEAAGIVWAVDHGADIVNLSIGGPSTSKVERDAIAFAIAHGVLVVAAAGNSGGSGDEPSYPAALLGSNGLAVAASTAGGTRAPFSTSGAYVSLAAPGVHVLGATTPGASTEDFPRASLPDIPGTYAYASGTSYAAPEVAGAAALVWAANPSLTAQGVIRVLEHTARGGGVWSPALGWGILDVAAAVAAAPTSN